MCATSDGTQRVGAPRSQPNSRPSGSTSMTCAGSKWAAAKASELTMQATPGAPAACQPAVEQAAEDQLLDERRQHRRAAARLPATLPARGAIFDRLLHALRARCPSWLTATDRASVPRVPNTIGRQPTGREAQRRQGGPAERRHGRRRPPAGPTPKNSPEERQQARDRAANQTARSPNERQGHQEEQESTSRGSAYNLYGSRG